MQIKDINISDIIVEDRLWTADECTIDMLIESIETLGLKTPISVRVDENNNYILIAGAHRLAACKKLGMEVVPCIIENIDKNYATLYEIDENLMRRTVTSIERSHQLVERKIAYEKIYGKDLSTKASFMRYYKDVDNIVNNGNCISHYDYTIFSESDFNIEYLRGRVATNNLEDLFGRYLNNESKEVAHRLSDKEKQTVIRLYPLMKEIAETFQFKENFITDTSNKLGLTHKTIKNELTLGSKITPNDLNLIKKANLNDVVARDILKRDQKSEYMEAIKEVVEKSDNIDGLNKHIQNSLKNAKQEVSKSRIPNEEESQKITKKAIEYIKNFDEETIKNNVQISPETRTDLYTNNFQKEAIKVAKIFGVPTSMVVITYENDEVTIRIKTKEESK